MYNISSPAVVSLIERYSRTFRAFMRFDDGRTITGSYIGSIEFEHIMSEDEAVPIGRILARHVEIHLYTEDFPISRNDSFMLYLCLISQDGSVSESPLSAMTHAELADYTHAQLTELCRDAAAASSPDDPVCGIYIPFGKYVISKITVSGIETTVTAYDRLAFAADKIYSNTVTLPASAADVLEDVLSQLGITGHKNFSTGTLLTSDSGELLTSDAEELLCSGDYGFTVGSIPKSATCAEVLEYIMAYYGRNGITDRYGNFTTIFISDGDSVSLDLEKADEPEIAVSDVQLSGITCNIDNDTTLEVGNIDGAHAIEIECPWMTEARLDELWIQLAAIAWRPGDVSVRIADPRIDIGDMLVCNNYSLPVTSLRYHFDGGLSADVSTCGQSDREEI